MPGIRPVVNDVLRVRVVVTTGDQIGENVMYYIVNGVTGAGAFLSEIAFALSSSFATPYRNWLGPDATYEGVGVRNITTSIGPPAVGQTPEYSDVSSRGAGLTGSALMPTQVTGMIRFLTNFTGPGGRGRIYLPFPSLSWAAGDGTMTNPALAQEQVIASILGPNKTIVGTGVTDMALVVRNQATNVVSLVRSITPIQKFATQRRRGDYGQKNTNPF